MKTNSARALDIVFVAILSLMLIFGTGIWVGRSFTGNTNTFAPGSLETTALNVTGDWYRGTTNLTARLLGTWGALVSTSLDTGQGAYELYGMDQNVLTTSDPTFDALTVATLDTGYGANDLFDMDQHVLTTSSPTFDDLTVSDQLSADVLNFTSEFYWNSVNRTDTLAYPEQPMTHLLWTDGAGNYYAKDCQTGQLVYSGTNTHTLFNTVESLIYIEGRGHVHIKAGTYPLERRNGWNTPYFATNTPNVLWTGDGFGTVIRAEDNTSQTEGVCLFRVNAPNVTIAHLAFDGNKANQGTWNNSVDGYNIQTTQNAHHFTLFNVLSANGTGDGVEPYGHYTSILNCRFIDNWEHNIHIHGNYSRIIDNHLEGEINNGQIDFYSDGPIGHSIITNNIILHGEQEGIKISSGTVGIYIYDVQVRGNYIENHTTNTMPAISVLRAHNIQITDNIMVNNNRGIHTEGSNYDVDIYDNKIMDSGQMGIYITGIHERTRITGNTIINPATNGIEVGAITGNFSTLIIRDNLIYNASYSVDRGGNNGIKLAFNDYYGDYVLVKDNQIQYGGGNRTTYEIRLQNAGNVSNIHIMGNVLDSGAIASGHISGASFATHVENNIGFITENQGTQTCADNEDIAHGLAGTPTFAQANPMNDTYDGVPVIATVDWSNVDGTNIQVGLYWVNGTAIADDVIFVSWYAKYEP